MTIAKNQKVFLSFAFTGLDPDVVLPRMKKICTAFKRIGAQPYCDLFDDDIQDFERAGEFVADAMEHIKRSDVVVVIKDSAHRSEGQLMEIGAAVAFGIPVILLLNESAEDATYLHHPELATETVRWSSDSGLLRAVQSLGQPKLTFPAPEV